MNGARRDPVLRARYSQGAGIYRIVPAAVARPETQDALRALIADAAREGAALIPRGAGSAMDGGNVGDGTIVDLTAFERGRCEVEPAVRHAHVSPAVPLDELQRAAAPHGLRLPPDPSSGRWATLGGMVSTNASGSRSVRYGSVRRWIEAVTLETIDGPLVLSRGEAADPRHPAVRRWHDHVEPLIHAHHEEIVTRFPKVTKNSAGYALDHYLRTGDLLDLVVGAEGTLGIVSDLRWRLDDVPRHRASLRVALRRRADLVPALDALRGFDPTTLELLDESFLRLVAPRMTTPERPELLATAAALLLADIEGDDPAEVAARCEAAVAAVGTLAFDVRVATDPDAIDALWAVRHGASPALAALDDGRKSLQVIEDGCVPRARLADYLDALDDISARHRIRMILFGHAGDGHVHVNLLPNLGDPDWTDRVRAIFHEATAAVIALGGTTSGEHGTGRLRAATLRPLYGDAIVAIFAAIKRAFDPAGLWNPGVLLSDAPDPIRRLKVGPDAAPLPAGTAEYLQAIEGSAGWAGSRWEEGTPAIL